MLLMRLLNVDDLHRYQNYANTVTKYTISVLWKVSACLTGLAQQHIVDVK